MKTIYYDSPLGCLRITASSTEITGLEFAKKQKNLEKSNKVLKQCTKELTEFFNGKRKKFTVPVLLKGTDFQKKVWKELQNIPFGKTLSYGDVARSIKKPKTARAVGMANNKNKIAIIIPCHRVIGHNGKLVGYASGLKRKKWLLEHEKAI